MHRVAVAFCHQVSAGNGGARLLPVTNLRLPSSSWEWGCLDCSLQLLPLALLCSEHLALAAVDRLLRWWVQSPQL